MGIGPPAVVRTRLANGVLPLALHHEASRLPPLLASRLPAPFGDRRHDVPPLGTQFVQSSSGTVLDWPNQNVSTSNTLYSYRTMLLSHVARH